MTELTSDDDGEVEGDNADDERMLFGEKREETTLLAGSGLGITRIDVAAAQVGQFSLLDRATVRGLASDGRDVVVATDQHVAVRTDDGLHPLGFGPAEAVGLDDSWIYAADGERVARLDRSAGLDATAGDWETVGSVDHPRRFAGDLLAGDRLVRVGDTLDAQGLSAVRDLSADGALAATADGVYERRGGEWVEVLAGDATAVVADGDRAHAVVDGRLLERDGAEWSELTLPGGETPHLLAYTQTLAVIDTAGTVHVAADPDVTHDGHGGWRSQAIGLPDVTALIAVR
ncbi:hypothetical protein GRX03_01570 [Halovenus sp. WSH3]|uniref:HVO-0234-like beta-propeller domain-containing protein n=1 Tax=Halovenus carboxidivorans TaxID=2692199 RepID=A0A6B0TAU7_9EURY|nr:hypothetical protein [Halovenus carboxidivorans]MXR50299.1 hypothetical protein [Halovenus carboxidivorans]